MKKYRIVECINIVWECEASTEKEARELYWQTASNPETYSAMLDEGSSDIECMEIDDEGNCV